MLELILTVWGGGESFQMAVLPMKLDRFNSAEPAECSLEKAVANPPEELVALATVSPMNACEPFLFSIA